jgi:hypothetical protein
MHYVSAGPLRVDVEALNDHMRPAGALRLRHAQVGEHMAAVEVAAGCCEQGCKLPTSSSDTCSSRAG